MFVKFMSKIQVNLPSFDMQNSSSVRSALLVAESFHGVPCGKKKRWTFACLMICKLLHFWWIANWRNCTFVSGSNRYSDMYSHALSVVTMRSYKLAVCSNIVDTTNCDRPVAEDDRPSLKKPMPFKNLSSRQLHFCRLSIFWKYKNAYPEHCTTLVIRN